MSPRPQPWPVALAVLVAVAAAARFVSVRGIPTPWVTPDETLYGLLARGLYTTGRLSVLDGRPGFYSAVYPALAGLPLSLGDISRGYRLLQLVQSVVVSLTAVLVYGWARSMTRPPAAFAAAVLTVAIPGLAYAGMVMSEVAFYVAVPLAAWATARALERPTFGRQAVVALAVGLAVVTRLQGFVLVPAVAGAILLMAAISRDRRGLRAFWPLGSAGLVAAIAAAAAGRGSLGGYASIASSGYDAARIAEFVGYHVGGLLLACGVVPLCALALLTLDAALGRIASRRILAFVSVALSFAAATVLLVGAFASRYSQHILERGLLCVVPVLFVGMAVWLDGAAGRRYATKAGIAFAAAAIAVLLPYDRFVHVGAVQDSMTFAAALRLAGDPLLLLGLGATVLAASFALLPGRAAPLLVGVLAVLFVGESAAAAREVATAAAAQQARLLGPEPRWVDRAGSGPVAVLYGGTGSFDAVWENAFWNRRIAAVYDLPGAHVLGPMPQHAVTVGRDGTLRSAGRPLPQPYAVLPSDVTPAGARIAFSPLAGSDIQGLALWRLERPARLLERRVGFLPNGDIPYSAELREFGCARGGTFLVTLLGKVDTTVEVYLNGRRVADVDVAAGEAPTHVVHAGAAADGSCTLWLKPSTLVGTTEARFARG